jgi:hypothetical protein
MRGRAAQIGNGIVGVVMLVVRRGLRAAPAQVVVQFQIFTVV